MLLCFVQQLAAKLATRFWLFVDLQACIFGWIEPHVRMKG